MSHHQAFVTLVILFCQAQERGASEVGQFLGGSLSFSIINGTNGSEIQLDLISGWVLGLGPCGINCSMRSLNSDTRLTRQEVFLKENDDRYFGSWKVRYIININGQAHRYYEDSITQHVYDGFSWRNLSLQDVNSNSAWHLQVRAIPDPRKDTGKPNNCPRGFSKPYYRLRLGEDNYINIPIFDSDGDYIECSMASYSEASLLTEYPHHNVTITKDCIILVNAHRSLGYENGSWGAIAVVIRDFTRNREELSTATVQFAVQFLDEVIEPRFLPPTPESNHRFSIYVGSVWNVEVYAEPNSPALIDHFSCIGRQQENVTIINVKDSLYLNHQNVKMATLTWTPLDMDIGLHIVCVDVEDTNGMDSSDQRCFILEVRKLPDTSQLFQMPMTTPYVFNFAGKDVLWCNVNDTCTFPIYAKTPSSGAHIKSIRIASSFLDWTQMDKEIKNNITTGVGQADISVRHTSAGSPQMCLHVVDSTGRVGDTCITIRIIPPDPCLGIEKPCIAGVCIRNADDLSKFHCQCATDHYYGQFCEMEKPDCIPNPCQHGRCLDKPGPDFHCICNIGWTGRLCETVVHGHTSIGSSRYVQNTTVKSDLWGINSPPSIVG